ncbi:gluconate 2-dehydrogenase subunit 3 family protein [Novosphingobium sp.]|uniref:gluconate 2-dehydrogenase subunit 3 family protein n=1 Tax=Novosphingobium sp. TaxID=1874826 RepID=UPI00333E7501
MTNNAWTRRDLFGVAAMVALQGTLPGGGMALLRSLDPRDAPSARQRKLMLTVADHVIPATTTPGAGTVGAGDFAIIALAHGLDGARRPLGPTELPTLQAFARSDNSLDHVRWLEHRLGGNWPTLPRAKRHALLAALDTSAFANDPAARPWRMIKGLILTGYYTSEVGGSQELQYELVPGRFDPKVPLAPGARAFSSDWTAVDFG